MDRKLQLIKYIRLLTFGKNLSGKMKEIESVFFVEVIVLVVYHPRKLVSFNLEKIYINVCF